MRLKMLLFHGKCISAVERDGVKSERVSEKTGGKMISSSLCEMCNACGMLPFEILLAPLGEFRFYKGVPNALPYVGESNLNFK